MSVRLGVMELKECLVLTEEWQVGSPNYLKSDWCLTVFLYIFFMYL